MYICIPPLGLRLLWWQNFKLWYCSSIKNWCNISDVQVVFYSFHSFSPILTIWRDRTVLNTVRVLYFCQPYTYLFRTQLAEPKAQLLLEELQHENISWVLEYTTHESYHKEHIVGWETVKKNVYWCFFMTYNSKWDHSKKMCHTIKTNRSLRKEPAQWHDTIANFILVIFCPKGPQKLTKTLSEMMLSWCQ